MSFMDNIGKIAGMFGGASPTDAAAAATDHVNSMDPSDLSSHLQQGVGNMDQSSLMALGSHLLASFQQNGQSPDQAAAAAGTDPAAVQSGDPSAITSMIQQAESNPMVLQSAAGQFLTAHPQVMSAMPGLLSGIMSRLGH